MTDTNSKAQVTDADVATALDSIRMVLKNLPIECSVLADKLLHANAVLWALAAQEKPEPGVAVKALEWEEAGGNVNMISAALTPFGDYYIEADPEGFALFVGSVGLLVHTTHSAAKAAAQADYEQRIRSALVSTQAQAGEPTLDMIDEAAKLIAKWIGYSWDGLRERDISDEFPDWATNGVGTLSMQGGKPALRKLAAKILAVALVAPSPDLPEGEVESVAADQVSTRTIAPVEVYRIIKDVVIDKENASAWSRRIATALSSPLPTSPSPIDKGEVK